ncbi:MAG: radical SAM protein [Oscillospiraceae bacterium]|nr:radical SAM protein [Oscillospiraceae bacterium]
MQTTVSVPIANLNESLTEKLNVVKIQRTCVHDGPGLRTAVFFAGCGLRCLWCQNPEAQSVNGGESRAMSVPEIAEVVLRDKRFYQNHGGVTLSGGEPFLQDTESMKVLLTLFRDNGLHIAAETSLHAPWENIAELLSLIDKFIVDLKAVGGDLHERLTGQDDSLIRGNIGNLLGTGADISFRMVMVPGLNDGEERVRAAAEYLKGIGHDRIELLKYHSMYEDKAARLGLDVPMLSISPDQSLSSLKNGIKLFEKYGVSACSDELMPKPPAAEFTQRVLDVQKAIRESERAICFEVGHLKTEYYKKFKGLKKPVAVHRGERLKYVLARKSLKVWPGELLVGNFTGKRVAGQIWEEQYGTLYALVLPGAHKQTPVQFISTKKERLDFYRKILPYWINKSTIARGMESLSNLILALARIAETSAGFNNNFAAIAHFIVNFDRILELGTSGLRAEVLKVAGEHPENNQDFYKGILLCLDALDIWACRYANHLRSLSAAETDPVRKKELEKMAEICRFVPMNPARTFHEALQSMMFLHLALCIEAYENAISFGRVDQILYPYFKRDLEAGIITYEEAKELFCLFILKMDEAILINDGDGILNLSKLFETLSIDQSLTFGGVDRQGNDATNDVTYMCVDACELQPLSVNMCARIHKDSPGKYLDRLAEVYINGCPMPELFSDSIYIETLMRHYDTTLENARNYSIVGCVEPVASDSHFGNTDCANMNLALPLLQALKGHEHDLWNFGFPMQVEKMVTRFIEYGFRNSGERGKAAVARREKTIQNRDKRRGLYSYDPPKSMDELLARFQTRLTALAKSIFHDQQVIERGLQKYFTTPLASALYKSSVERGMDVYEGGADYNTAGIQAVGVTDVADSLYAINELVWGSEKYTLEQIIRAIDANFEGEGFDLIRKDILAIPKFGDDSSPEPALWTTKVMEIYNNVLDSFPYATRNGSYTAGYYALNTSDRYGLKTQALPSGRLKGAPLANSVAPHYGMEQADLLSALNAMSGVNFTDYAVNGSTATLTVDAALFPGREGVRNLSNIFRTFLTTGGIQFQPNVISRELLVDAYNNPEKHRYLMVRVAGYCAYFNELSDDLKKVIINRTCYS